MLQFIHLQLPVRLAMARLPCTHFGSMRLSQGLLIGKGHTTTDTHRPFDAPVVRLRMPAPPG